MNTIVIWDIIEDAIRFFNLEGDFTHLNGVYINSAQDQEKQDELNLIVYNEEGNHRVHMQQDFPYQCFEPGKTKVIVCGFIT